MNASEKREGYRENNNLWANSEEITLLMILLLMVLVMYSCPGTTDTPALFSHVPDFFRIDLNQANWQELDLLPGIGPARAQSIIKYRETHGKFGDLHDLTQIPGITDKTMHKIKDRVVY